MFCFILFFVSPTKMKKEGQNLKPRISNNNSKKFLKNEN